MNSISVSYTLIYQIKGYPNYQMTQCGKMFNVKSGREIRKRYNGGSLGYWIGANKFLVIKKDNKHKILEKIPYEHTPF